VFSGLDSNVGPFGAGDGEIHVYGELENPSAMYTGWWFFALPL